jgi:hypothetical protein
MSHPHTFWQQWLLKTSKVAMMRMSSGLVCIGSCKVWKAGCSSFKE